MIVRYELDGPVARVTMDDGKANALSPTMLGELSAAFTRAESDGAAVLLSGREGRFSGGFDLKVLQGGGPDAGAMLRAGFELAEQVLSFPRPVVIACTGHAVAMGVFVLLSGDYRIGIAGGGHKIVANEVAIGLTMPHSAIELLRQRLTPAAFVRALMLSEVFDPDTAVPAGFLDAVVPADELASASMAAATSFAALDATAHRESKARGRAPVLDALRSAMKADGF